MEAEKSADAVRVLSNYKVRQQGLKLCFEFRYMKGVLFLARNKS